MLEPEEVEDNIEQLWTAVGKLQASNGALRIVLTELFRGGFEGARALAKAKQIARDSGSLSADDPYRNEVAAVLGSIEAQLAQEPDRDG